MRLHSLDLMYAHKVEQFLTRISNYKLSSLSEHIRCKNHVELRSPNEDDPKICFDIFCSTDVRDGNIGFL